MNVKNKATRPWKMRWAVIYNYTASFSSNLSPPSPEGNGLLFLQCDESSNKSFSFMCLLSLWISEVCPITKALGTSLLPWEPNQCQQQPTFLWRCSYWSTRSHSSLISRIWTMTEIFHCSQVIWRWCMCIRHVRTLLVIQLWPGIWNDMYVHINHLTI